MCHCLLLRITQIGGNAFMKQAELNQIARRFKVPGISIEALRGQGEAFDASVSLFRHLQKTKRANTRHSPEGLSDLIENPRRGIDLIWGGKRNRPNVKRVTSTLWVSPEAVVLAAMYCGFKWFPAVHVPPGVLHGWFNFGEWSFRRVLQKRILELVDSQI